MIIDYNLPVPNIAGTPLYMMPLTDEQAAVATELWERHRASTSLTAYAERVVGVVPADHHRYICDTLEQGILNDEWDDCVICIPPGGAKSTYASHCLPSWFLGHFPDKNVILASHTAGLAEKWSRRVRDTLSTAEHTRVFPESLLSKDSTAVSKWGTSQNGEFLAAGVGMSILGFRADLACIDDPVSGWEQAQSMTQLEKIHDWYKSDLKSRLKPHAKIVIICQRTAAYDLAGFVIKQHEENPTRRLKTIVMPMICKDTETDPLHRQVGARLWPEWYTDEMVVDLRKDDFIWRTMYQQEPPADEGSWVSTDDIQFRPTPTITPDSVTYGMTDLALSVNTGDYTVHIIVAIDDKGDWDIVEAVRERVDVDVSASRIVDLSETYKPREWLCDDDNASKVFKPLVATRSRQRGVTVPWTTLPMRGQDKETRAAALRGQFKRRKVYMSPNAAFTSWLTKELLLFPNAVGSGVDDGVDALGLLGRRMMYLTHASTPSVPVKCLTTADMTLDQLFEDAPNRQVRRI